MLMLVVGVVNVVAGLVSAFGTDDPSHVAAAYFAFGGMLIDGFVYGLRRL